MIDCQSGVAVMDVSVAIAVVTVTLGGIAGRVRKVGKPWIPVPSILCPGLWECDRGVLGMVLGEFV